MLNTKKIELEIIDEVRNHFSFFLSMLNGHILVNHTDRGSSISMDEYTKFIERWKENAVKDKVDLYDKLIKEYYRTGFLNRLLYRFKGDHLNLEIKMRLYRKYYISYTEDYCNNFDTQMTPFINSYGIN